MADGDLRMGLDGKFLWGTAGATPSTVAGNIETCTLNLSARSAEALTRGSEWVGFKVYALEAGITFTIFDQEGDDFLTALQTAYFGRSRIALYPKDAEAGEGLDCDCYITNFSRDESNPDFIKYNVEAKPTNELRTPAWN